MAAGIDLATAPLVSKMLGAVPLGAMLGIFSRRADDLPVGSAAANAATASPSQVRVNRTNGLAFEPAAGGRYRETFTYGTQADVDLTPRQALGLGIWDTRRIYQHDGLYGPGIRSSLQDVIRKNRAAIPGLFDK
jgi:hypothetical protein